jgi:hypothetical protein
MTSMDLNGMTSVYFLCGLFILNKKSLRIQNYRYFDEDQTRELTTPLTKTQTKVLRIFSDIYMNQFPRNCTLQWDGIGFSHALLENGILCVSGKGIIEKDVG